MSFSSGVFSINTAGQPVVTGTVISSTAFNALTADLATGLSTCLLKDGTQTATALVPFALGFSSAALSTIDKGSTGDHLVIGHTVKAYVSENGTQMGITTATANGGTGFTATSSTASLVVAGNSVLSGTASALTTADNLTILTGTAIPAGGTQSIGYMFSSASSFGIFFGSGAPNLTAAKGSLYLRSDGSGTNDRMYVNTNGSTTWTAVVTVA